MSSTSSSECECDEYCTYGAGFGNQSSYGKLPFYPTMRNPLIYYAQVPQPSKSQRSRESRKDDRNCFAKAFRWYTQEHVPYRSESPNKTDMNGFAAWLDSKYDDFLRESQLDSVYHLRVQHTSFIEADRIPKNTCCEPRSKKFRVKSPWRRKRPTSSKEAGDVIQKPNHSFQFILQPKDLTVPTSECCEPSNATMVSAEIPMKSTIKSQSYTILSQEHHQVEPDAPLSIHELNQPERGDKPNKDCDVKSIYKQESRNRDAQNISCQCSVAKVVKMNAQTQYEDTEIERVTASDNQITPNKILCQPCQKTLPTTKKEIAIPAVSTSPKEIQVKAPIARNTMQCQCSEEIIPRVDAQIQYQTQYHVERATSLSTLQSSSKTYKTCPCESDMQEFNVENLTHFPTPITFSNDGVQTSDHSISFGMNAVHGYPLFMKIVCADKLCK